MKRNLMTKQVFCQGSVNTKYSSLVIISILLIGCVNRKIENDNNAALYDSIVQLTMKKAGIFDSTARFDETSNEIVWKKPSILEVYAKLKYPENIDAENSDDFQPLLEDSCIHYSSRLRKIYKIITREDFNSNGYVVESRIMKSYYEVSMIWFNKETTSFYLEVTAIANNGRDFVVFGKVENSQIRIDSIINEKVI
jgi:hypothetical protein